MNNKKIKVFIICFISMVFFYQISMAETSAIKKSIENPTLKQIIPTAQIISTSGKLNSTVYFIKNPFHIPSLGPVNNTYSLKIKGIHVVSSNENKKKGIKVNQKNFIQKFIKGVKMLMNQKGYLMNTSNQSKAIFTVNIDNISYSFNKKTEMYGLNYNLTVSWKEDKKNIQQKTSIFVSEQNIDFKAEPLVLDDLTYASIAIFSSFFTNLGYPPVSAEGKNIAPTPKDDFMAIKVDKDTKKLAVQENESKKKK